MASEDDKKEGFNPRRPLCPDGSCIGIIGADGKCTVCGRSGGAAAEPSGEPQPADDEGAMAADAGDELEETADIGDDDDPAFDSTRRLCSDDTCIGVIGSDDRCSVCGKPARG